ncbi:hypothetical protein Glove_7g24 [Diversispora epigaea]|uniref:Uncharacterized protein n=1 Tax=Diversispora epigaea TaxID=1348612 RepID=A0A397JT42_9GLOM|nr:hypothetical protein Glove_7g24 [Diversispora epigaea]
MYIAWGVAIAQLFLNPKIKGIQISENLLKKQMKINFRKLQNKLPLKPGDGELEAEHTTEEESKEWEEEKRSPKRRRTSGGRVFSPRLDSPRLGSDSPRLGSGSPQLASSWLPVSPQLFESPDTPDITREEGDTTGGDTEGAEIVEQ